MSDVIGLAGTVKDIVNEFVLNNTLFTALDVSNKVKETLPFAKHREIRDIVRTMFYSDIEPCGYSRTPINVTLSDGSVREALLYHPSQNSWDLDSLYDSQMRSQTSNKSQTTQQLPQTQQSVTLSPISLWDQLFSSAKSLFPSK